MVIIISNDQKFIKFCSDTANHIGYIFMSSNYENAVDIIKRSKADIAVVHSPENSEILAKECVSAIALRTPETKILTAVEKSEDSPSLYLDIEGSHRQINLPCSSDDLIHAFVALYPPFIKVNQLDLGRGRKCVTLLGERLSLSKNNYIILRLTAKAYPNELDLSSLRSILPTMTDNCLAVHINTINKAAARITERRLIVFKDGYKLNEFM